MIFFEKKQWVEARAGIEPACKDLQSSASPLRHRAPVSIKLDTASLYVVEARV